MNAPQQPRQTREIVSAPLVVIAAILVLILIAVSWVMVMGIGLLVLWALGG